MIQEMNVRLRGSYSPRLTDFLLFSPLSVQPEPVVDTKKTKVTNKPDKVPSKSSKETSNKRKKETAEASDQEVKQPAAKRKRTTAASQETKSPSKDVNEEPIEGKAFGRL